MNFSLVPFLLSEDEESVNQALLEEELANEVLEHCFQQHKFQEKYPHVFLKLKASRFGPPKSRRRILIAPPMEGMAPSCPKAHLPTSVEKKEKLRASEEPPAKVKAAGGDDLQKLDAWIEERKKLHELLDNCVNLEKWLSIKQPTNDQEEMVLGKMRQLKKLEAAKSEALLSAVSSIQHLMPKRPRKRITPSIKAPYPDSLLTLQNILQKHKLKLVDIFHKVDKSRTMKFKRKDFLKVMQEVLRPPTTSTSVSASASACNKPKPLKPPKVTLLQVPPINTEPDAMHLDWEDMEMVGKRNKEMRRRLKVVYRSGMTVFINLWELTQSQQCRKVSPIEWLEQCRMVKTGDRAVDGHCLPSTIEGEMGEVIDKFRLDTHLVYHRCLKTCEALGIPITEKVLKRALLYAGDKIVRDGKNIRKLRQPGGYYGSVRDVSTDEESSSSSEERRRRRRVPKKKEVKEKQVKESKPLKFRWKSYAEFKTLMKSSKLYAPVEIWSVKSFDDGSRPVTPRKKSTSRLSRDGMSNEMIERELRKMYAHLNPLTTPNSFWPGHLLDKLRLCRPEMQGDEAEALFSLVRPPRPVYPATYSPDRSWPINDQRYVTFGDPTSQKEHYYI
ncbi:hypothetical protein lerEdw1_015671 [Lerista edwardsae]|nr:hypothetical protein lerEdw1_015671 [Lerista edwardsae]